MSHGLGRFKKEAKGTERAGHVGPWWPGPVRNGLCRRSAHVGPGMSRGGSPVSDCRCCCFGVTSPRAFAEVPGKRNFYLNGVGGDGAG